MERVPSWVEQDISRAIAPVRHFISRLRDGYLAFWDQVETEHQTRYEKELDRVIEASRKIRHRETREERFKRIRQNLISDLVSVRDDDPQLK